MLGLAVLVQLSPCPHKFRTSAEIYEVVEIM